MDIEQRARELLASALMEKGEHLDAAHALSGDMDGTPAHRAIIAALTPPDCSDQNLLELAATFETCIAFLPPVGRRNIAKAVDQLRYKGMTTAEGHVVVTRNEAGQAVAVTRQDDEGRILSVIAEFEPAKGDMGNPISVPDGYVLVPVEPTESMQIAAEKANPWLIRYEAPEIWAAMLAARPEVKP